MNKIIKGLSYTFSRNIGKTDRAIRAAFAIVGIVVAYNLYPSYKTTALVLGIFSLMMLMTALVSRCGFNYWIGVCTISDSEKQLLDSKGIKYEN